MRKASLFSFGIASMLAATLLAAAGAQAAYANIHAGGQRSAGAHGNVFLIIGENTSASEITAAHAPYLAGTLKPRAAWFSGYRSFKKSSSLGEYIAMTSGQYTKCEAANALPDTCHQHINNVFQQLATTHRGWFVYAEGAANPCDIVDDGAAWSKNIYSAHHNPALYYTAIHGKLYDEAITPNAACRTRDLPMGTTGPNNTNTLDAALATGKVGALTVIIPNDCENGHDPCGTHDPVRQFDRFLAREIPKIEHSPAYGSTSTIIITWDEGADPPLDPANPLLLAIGPQIRPGVNATAIYNHYSLLRTLEDHFGLPALARARMATPLPIFG